jgi:hypothetical protein
MTAIANIFPIIKPLSALPALPVYPRKRGVNCVNFGTANMMHQVQL